MKNTKSAATYSEVHRKYIKKEIEIEHVHAFVRSYQLTLDERSFAHSSPNSVVLGTMILWVAWMSFNGGSSLGGITLIAPEGDVYSSPALTLANKSS